MSESECLYPLAECDCTRVPMGVTKQRFDHQPNREKFPINDCCGLKGAKHHYPGCQNVREGDLISYPYVEDPEMKEESPGGSLHYHGDVEPIDLIEAQNLGFREGSAIKYISRAGKKGDKLTDIKKARWMLDRIIEELEDGE